MILLLAMLGIVLVKAILERLGLVVGVHRILRNVEVSEGHAQGASYGEHADVVAGKLNGLASAPEVRGQRIQRHSSAREHPPAAAYRCAMGDARVQPSSGR